MLESSRLVRIVVFFFLLLLYSWVRHVTLTCSVDTGPLIDFYKFWIKASTNGTRTCRFFFNLIFKLTCIPLTFSCFHI